jgi:hypothetical protein
MENTRRQERSMESKQCDYEIPNEYDEPIAKFLIQGGQEETTN